MYSPYYKQGCKSTTSPLEDEIRGFEEKPSLFLRVCFWHRIWKGLFYEKYFKLFKNVTCAGTTSMAFHWSVFIAQIVVLRQIMSTPHHSPDDFHKSLRLVHRVLCGKVDTRILLRVCNCLRTFQVGRGNQRLANNCRFNVRHRLLLWVPAFYDVPSKNVVKL